MNIKDFTKKNNTFRGLYSKSIKVIEDKLNPGEEIKYAFMSDVTISDLLNGQSIVKNDYRGAVVLSNQRLMFGFKVFGPELFKEVKIEDITADVLGQETFGLQTESITCKEFVLIYNHRKEIVEEFHKELHLLRKPYIQASQLKALDIRLMNGIITQEQYDETKKKILEEKITTEE